MLNYVGKKITNILFCTFHNYFVKTAFKCIYVHSVTECTFGVTAKVAIQVHLWSMTRSKSEFCNTSRSLTLPFSICRQWQRINAIKILTAIMQLLVLFFSSVSRIIGSQSEYTYAEEREQRLSLHSCILCLFREHHGNIMYESELLNQRRHLIKIRDLCYSTYCLYTTLFGCASLFWAF